jgi:hypothetical protein
MRLTNAPTDALSTAANDRANAPTNAPTNAANGIHTRPPIPPSALAPSRAASGTARAARIRTRLRYRSARVQTLRPVLNEPAGWAAEGWNRPRHAVMRVDIQQPPFPTIAARTALSLAERVRDSFLRSGCTKTAGRAPTHQWLSYGLCAASVVPPASRPLIKRDCTPHNPLWDNQMCCLHHLSDDQKGIYARALSRPLALLEGKARARHQASNRWRNVDCEAFIGIGGSKDPLGMPGGRNLLGRQIIDLSSRYNSSLSEILGRRCPEKAGFRRGSTFKILAAIVSKNPRLP